MTIREFAKLNNFPIRGKLTRIPDEVEYDFNDPAAQLQCGTLTRISMNTASMRTASLLPSPAKRLGGSVPKRSPGLPPMIEKERMEARQRRGSYEW